MIPGLLLQIQITVVTLTIGLADHSADVVDQIADFVGVGVAAAVADHSAGAADQIVDFVDVVVAAVVADHSADAVDQTADFVGFEVFEYRHVGAVSEYHYFDLGYN